MTEKKLDKRIIGFVVVVYVTSAYFTYLMLTRFVDNEVMRFLTLACYEGGLAAWGIIHHCVAETYEQHMLSSVLEWVSMAAVLSASVLYLFTLEEHVLGWDVPVYILRIAIPITGAASFGLNIFAAVKWFRLSLYYQEHVKTLKTFKETGVDRVAVIEQKLDQLLLPAPKDERSSQDKDEAVREFLRTHDNVTDKELAMATGIPLGSISSIRKRVNEQDN